MKYKDWFTCACLRQEQKKKGGMRLFCPSHQDRQKRKASMHLYDRDLSRWAQVSQSMFLCLLAYRLKTRAQRKYSVQLVGLVSNRWLFWLWKFICSETPNVMSKHKWFSVSLCFCSLSPWVHGLRLGGCNRNRLYCAFHTKLNTEANDPLCIWLAMLSTAVWLIHTWHTFMCKV